MIDPRPEVPQLIDRPEAEAISAGTHTDPFAVLGAHRTEHGRVLRVFDPGAETLSALMQDGSEVPLAPVPHARGLFAGLVPDGDYRVRGRGHGNQWEFDDPYSFGPVLGDMDEYLIAEGTHLRLWTAL
ncbi:MAG: 1,4-alpha-glucan branching enzyme, partial [Pseudomonadota bacterium]